MFSPNKTIEHSPTKIKIKSVLRTSNKNSNWPTYGNNFLRQHYSDVGIKPPFNLQWQRKDGFLLEFSPVIIKNKLFILNNKCTLKAYNKKTGEILWIKKLGFLAARTPTYYKKKLFVVCLSKEVTAVNLKGKIIWSKTLPSRSESTPAIDRKGRVWFGSENGTLYTVSAKTGKNIQTFLAAGPIKGSVAINNNSIFFATYKGYVYKLNYNNNLIWFTSTNGLSFNRGGNFYATPTIVNKIMIVGNTDGNVYAYDIISGQIKWKFKTYGFVYSAAAVSSSKKVVFVGSYDGYLYALSVATGRRIWSFNLKGRISGAPSNINRIVYVSSIANPLTVALDERNGKLLWSLKAGGFNPAVGDNEHLYITTWRTLRAYKQRNLSDKN